MGKNGHKSDVNLTREMTGAWVDGKAGELFELSSYVDEKGWNTQAINRTKAREFILLLLDEIQERYDRLVAEERVKHER